MTNEWQWVPKEPTLEMGEAGIAAMTADDDEPAPLKFYAAYTHAIAAAPPRSGDEIKSWPFVESPGEFTARLKAAQLKFRGDLLAAVRHVLIEQPAALAPRTRIGRRNSTSELREALEFAATFKITDGNRQEVAEDSLHEIRKIAARALAKSSPASEQER